MDGTGSALAVLFVWDYDASVSAERTARGHVSAAQRREHEAAALEPGRVVAGSGGDLRRRR